MHRVVEVLALDRYKIRVEFDDGTRGEVDLADLAGEGVFASWNQPGAFEKAFVDPATHTVAWPGGIDLCPDSLYEELVEQQEAA